LRRNGVTERNVAHAADNDEIPHEMLAPILHRIRSGDAKLTSSAEGAFRAFLAYYMSRADSLGVTPDQIVSGASEFAKSAGLSKLPSFSEKTAKKLNLVGMKGIVIDDDDAD
jgi:hypothetical protein